MKTVLLVPGFRQSLLTHDYMATISAIENRGYKVVFIPIEWRHTSIDDWIAQLNVLYEKYDSKETILAGFSYGAMTVFGAAGQRLPSELWLFSLSPYFTEDMLVLKLAWLRSIGKQRQERFWRMSFVKIAPKITCKVLLFIGKKEALKFPPLKKRVMQANKQLRNVRLIEIPDCGHDVTSAPYIGAIQEVI